MVEEGEDWVVPMLSGNGDKNLGTTFRKIISRAGIDVWPKLFQNCLVKPTDRTCSAVSDLRRLCLAWQHAFDCP